MSREHEIVAATRERLAHMRCGLAEVSKPREIVLQLLAPAAPSAPPRDGPLSKPTA